MILLQVQLHRRRDGERVDAVVGCAVADDCPADVLQGEGESPNEGRGQEGLEEHTGAGVLVVLQQPGDVGGVEDAGVVRIEAEVMVPLLDPGVQRAAVAPEADGEQVVLLRRVPQQEGALGLALQQGLSCILVHDAPVAGVVVDAQQVGHQAVHIVHLGVVLRG